MSKTPLEQALSNFVICGLVRSPLSPDLETKLRNMAPHIYPLGNYGQFFFTTPGYLDWAENEDSVLLKLGFARFGDDFANASAILASGLAKPSGMDQNRLRGNACLLCFDKHRPQLCVYKTLLSIQECYFTEIDPSLFISNNLGTLARFLGQPQVNPKAISLHFIFSKVPGTLTYFREISCLLPGEILHKMDTHLQTKVCYTLRELAGESYGRQPVQSGFVDEFFDQMKLTMGRYLKATTDTVPHWTMLLSGGVDSSLLQLAINSQLPAGTQPTSHTATLDVASFVPEIEYARAASNLLGTQHTFVPVDTNDFAVWLITAVKILGQPTEAHQDVYMTAFYASMASQYGWIKYMFSGQGADCMHGLNTDLNKYSYFIEKYRPWMLVILRSLSGLLMPFAPQKARGARRVIDMMQGLVNPDSHNHPLNSAIVYTDWETMVRCFTPSEIHDALRYVSDLEVDYFNSANLIEKVHIVHLVGDAIDSISLNNQLANAFGVQDIFPFLDDDILLATFRFDPRERFFQAGRTKPILKQILETKTNSGTTKARKLGGAIGRDLFEWMQHGVLRELVCDIKQPRFMSREDFKRIIKSPNRFTWNALTFDLFEKNVVLPIYENILHA